MNFHHRRTHDEPEINLIPLIDVLLVILIFLAASTSFNRVRQLTVALPQAQAEASDTSPALELTISRDGQYALDGRFLSATDQAILTNALQQAAAQQPDSALRINADGQTPHAAVVLALESARQAGLARVYFLTEAGP
ncbi:biopolymer transporter ExbD [Castellaniella sp.]|uniref:ExbD/TolR family protein n=1 Tax=Castellaniella sp. TaxID=1955812 RepID=UPI002AFFD1D7|nr:biopolymer transporter ExbD [Castellaniella sp.]